MRCEGSCSVVELSCSARSREDMIVGFCVGSHGELLLDNESASRESFFEGTSTLLSLLSPPDSRLTQTAFLLHPLFSAATPKPSPRDSQSNNNALPIQ